MISPWERREIADCFSIGIPTTLPDEEISYWLERQGKINRAAKKMIDGTLSMEEFLDILEESAPNIDEHLDGAEENLQYIALAYNMPYIGKTFDL